MRVETYTATGSGGENEDLALAGESWAVVLDGASQYPGIDIECVHSVAWVTGRLGEHLRAGLDGGADLVAVLRQAIRSTAADHGHGCNVNHPLALGATVAMVRDTAERVEWLVLGDAAVVVEHLDGRVEVATDDRLEHLPDPPITDAEVRTFEPAYVARYRNQPGGFWVASTVPEAADHALTGHSLASQVRRVLLVSDGITRLVERYGHTWPDLLTLTGAVHGIRSLVDAVRRAELADPEPRRWRGKRHDDATAILVHFHHQEGA